jgi:acetyl esterase
MPIDPELAAYFARVAQALPAPATLPVAARRARMEAIAERFPAAPDAVAREDRFIALPGRELLARVYRPAPGVLPVLVYCHGGGWVAGSVATHDGTCAALAADAGIVVVSVEYRRPPEHPFPAPNDDAYAALRWVAEEAAALGVDATRLAVGGDSAGAHLAAGVALEARDRAGPALAFQLLIYPVIEPDFATQSYRAHASGPPLTRDDMIEYWGHYLPDPGTRDPRAVPSRAAALAGLPAAHVVVAELDPLHDEGLRYAELLRRAGVAVACVEAPRLTHGFLRAAPYVHAAREAQRALGVATGNALRAR